MNEKTQEIRFLIEDDLFERNVSVSVSRRVRVNRKQSRELE